MKTQIEKSRDKWKRLLKASRKERIKVLIDQRRIKSEDDLPDGAIPARISNQNSDTGSLLGYTRPFYEDYKYCCIDCRKEIIWTAEDQAWAYEELKIPAIAVLKRCPSCRLEFEKKRDRDVERMQIAQKERVLRKSKEI